MRISIYGFSWEVFRTVRNLEFSSVEFRATLTLLLCASNSAAVGSTTRYAHAKHVPILMKDERSKNQIHERLIEWFLHPSSLRSLHSGFEHHGFFFTLRTRLFAPQFVGKSKMTPKWKFSLPISTLEMLKRHTVPYSYGPLPGINPFLATSRHLSHLRSIIGSKNTPSKKASAN